MKINKELDDESIFFKITHRWCNDLL